MIAGGDIAAVQRFCERLGDLTAEIGDDRIFIVTADHSVRTTFKGQIAVLYLTGTGRWLFYWFDERHRPRLYEPVPVQHVEQLLKKIEEDRYYAKFREYLLHAHA